MADSGPWHIAYHSTSNAPEFAQTELTLPDKAMTLLRWHYHLARSWRERVPS